MSFTHLFTKSLAGLAFLTFAAPFAANASTCSGTLEDGRSVRVDFSVLDAGLRKAESTLKVGDAEIPRSRRYCMEDQGGYRCPHRSDAENFEVYPRLEADGSFVIHVIARNDDGTNVQSVVLDCGE